MTLNRGAHYDEAGFFFESINVSAADHDFTEPPRAVYIGTDGDLAVTDQNGTSVTFVDAGGLLPIRPSRILTAGTTASGIIAIS